VKFEIPAVVVRLGAAASIAAGLLLIAGFALHPAGEDARYGTDPFWVPAHALLWGAFTVALLGWVALYAAQAARAGRLGAAAFVVVLFGSSYASWIFSSDVTYVPVIAARAPALFDEIFTPGHLATGISSVLTWVAGNVLFGISTVRAKVLPGWAGVLLAVGAVCIPIAYLSGLPVRAVAVGGLLAGTGQIGLGVALLRAPSSA
jgi:hypothetical protein